MKVSLTLLAPFLILLSFTACLEEPEYDVEPFITSIDDIYFIDTDRTDSLVITIAFQDGDGDLGLTAREEEFIRPFEIVTNSEGNPIVYDENDPDLPPFNCEDYAFPQGLDPLVVGIDTITDTIRVIRNPFIRNFEVTIFERQPDGSYQDVNFLRTYCRQPLGGRFPPLKDDFSNDKPRVGTITFFAQSLSFKSLFRNDSIKLGVVIRDRAGHESNMRISEPFVLPDITRLSE